MKALKIICIVLVRNWKSKYNKKYITLTKEEYKTKNNKKTKLWWEKIFCFFTNNKTDKNNNKICENWGKPELQIYRLEKVKDKKIIKLNKIRSTYWFSNN